MNPISIIAIIIILMSLGVLFLPENKETEEVKHDDDTDPRA